MAAEWTGADYQRAMFQRTDLFRMVQGWFRRRLPGDADAVAHRAADRPGDLFGRSHRRYRVGDPGATGSLHHAVQHHNHPCLTLCCGYDSEGLPIGLQFVGRFRDEASVLRAAALYEASEDWLSRWRDL